MTILYKKIMGLAFLAWMTGGWVLAGEPVLHEAEYAIKAAFLRNFFQFVKWPPHRLPQGEAPFVACILGDNPFARQLNPSHPPMVQGHQLEFRAITSLQPGQDCHLLFVTASEGARQLDILRQVPAEVLTVGDAPGFAQAGGMINFYLWQDRIRFEINVKAARQSGLVLSSKLLSLARLVGEGTPP